MGFLVTFFFLVLSAVLVPPVAPSNITITSYDDPRYGTFTLGHEPRGRGTFGIILSCTVTFFFCIWTAVHPNIIAGGTRRNRVAYKAFLMFLSIILPEGLALCAFAQWREAKILLFEWRTKMGIPQRTWAEKLKFWQTAEDDGLGLDGAFFVVMGGFVVDLSTTAAVVPDDELGPRWTTLTSKGFIKYLKEGYIHKDTFLHEAIADKGKSSSIAKSIAGVQALWFMAQCVSRWWVGLTVTLLEIHVGIQVIFTMVLFVFWWSKPLDVGVPIKIILRLEDESGEKTIPNFHITPTFSELDLEWEEVKSDKYLLDEGTKTQSFITRPSPPGLLPILAKASHDLLICINEGHIGAGEHDSKLAMAFEASMMVIGGSLHAVAWNSEYPTIIECWLWRVCSIGICVLPIVIGLLTVLSQYHLELAMVLWKFQLKKHSFSTLVRVMYSEAGKSLARHAPEGSRPGSIRKYFLPVVQLSASCITISLYAVSILFITVESYLCLRSPPIDAFLTPLWTDYWPHV